MYSAHDYSYEFENEFKTLHIEDFDDMRKHMKNILSLVYLDGDLEDLEIELEELAAHFDLNLPKAVMNLERKKPLFNTKMNLVNALERFAKA